MKINLKMLGIIGGSILGGAAIGYAAGTIVEGKKNREIAAMDEATLMRAGIKSADDVKELMDSYETLINAHTKQTEQVEKLQANCRKYIGQLDALEDEVRRLKSLPNNLAPYPYYNDDPRENNPDFWNTNPPEDIPPHTENYGIDIYGEEDMTDEEINNAEIITFYVKDNVFADKHERRLHNPIALIGENGYRAIIDMAKKNSRNDLYIVDHDIKAIYRVELDYDYPYEEEDDD